MTPLLSDEVRETALLILAVLMLGALIVIGQAIRYSIDRSREMMGVLANEFIKTAQMSSNLDREVRSLKVRVAELEK